MKPEDIAALLNAQPFHPLEVFTNHGRSLLIGHRELANLTTSVPVVFEGIDEPTGIPERFSILPLDDIARIDVRPRRTRRRTA